MRWNMTDEELVKLYKDGDEAAFEQLCERFKKLIVSFSRYYGFLCGDTEDLIQEGFLGLMNAARRYDGTKENASSFGTFAYLCIRSKMRNAAVGGINNAQLAKNELSIEGIDIEDETVSPEEKLIEDETLKEKKEKILSRLSEFEKNVFELFLRGDNYVEIAEKLSVSPKSVDNALYRIKEKSRNISC